LTVAREVPAISASCSWGERDDRVAAGVQRAQLRKPAEPAPFDRDVEGLEQELVLPSNLPGEEADQNLVDCRVLPAQPLERRDVNGKRLRLLERFDSGRALRPLRHERHHAEAVLRTADADRDSLPERRHDPDREPTLAGQVQRVGRILAVEDDLVARQAAPASDPRAAAAPPRRERRP
jgi:hypothetical protein